MKDEIVTNVILVENPSRKFMKVIRITKVNHVASNTFSTAYTLKIHVYKIHEGHRHHKCVSCSKSFTTAAYLKKHIHTMHEGHNDYKSEYCGKTFTPFMKATKITSVNLMPKPFLKQKI